MSCVRLILVLIVTGWTAPAWAQESAESSPFEIVLQRATIASQSDEWTTKDWDDQQLESSLATLIDHLRKITGNDQLKLPVSFESVRPFAGSERGQVAYLTDELFVAHRGKVSHASRSIILADESIEISHAYDCLVIARGAVDVSHGGGNLILAGHYIHTSHDGHRDKKFPDVANGSVLISGSVVDVSHARDTVVCGPTAVTMGHVSNTVLINPPNQSIPHTRNSNQVTDHSSTLQRRFPEHRWRGELTVTKIVPPDDDGSGAMLVTDDAGVETMTRVGEKIPAATDEGESWKLVFVGEQFALLANEGQYAGVWKSESSEE